MSDPITIVMYHYVRPLAGSDCPALKGLDLDRFRGQLDYLCKHHSIVGMRDVLAARAGGQPLPPTPAVLTFDDGFRDHSAHVFPILKELGLPGVFFPASCAVLNRKMLDVHKVHFLLASEISPELIVADLERQVHDAMGVAAGACLATNRELHWRANRLDNAQTVYIKRMLQTALPLPMRASITANLFRRFVSEDEHAFADELYLSVDDLRRMHDGGMEIGSHGGEHFWLNSLRRAEQEQDIRTSLDMLAAAQIPRLNFLFCYPYGAFNDDTLEVLRGLGCGAAVTTEVALATIEDDPLRLPRLDTVDLPTRADTPAVEWTRDAGRITGAEAFKWGPE